MFRGLHSVTEIDAAIFSGSAAGANHFVEWARERERERDAVVVVVGSLLFCVDDGLLSRGDLDDSDETLAVIDDVISKVKP